MRQEEAVRLGEAGFGAAGLGKAGHGKGANGAIHIHPGVPMIDFSRDKIISDQIAALFDACKSLNRGDILHHEVTQSILGVPPGDERWKYCIAKLKRRMEGDRGITIWSEYGVGYRLLTQDEQIKVGRIRRRRAKRDLIRGHRSIGVLPIRGLTLHQRRLRNFEMELLSRELHILRADTRRSSIFARDDRFPNPRMMARGARQPAEAQAAQA
jgi:hypothetical protein